MVCSLQTNNYLIINFSWQRSHNFSFLANSNGQFFLLSPLPFLMLIQGSGTDGKARLPNLGGLLTAKSFAEAV